MNEVAHDRSVPRKPPIRHWRSQTKKNLSPLIFVILTTGLLTFLWIRTPEGVVFVHRFLGLIIGVLTLAPWFWWLRSSKKSIPFFEFISTHYFLIFCPAVFLGPVVFVGAAGNYQIDGVHLTKTLLIIILGITSLNIGHYFIRIPRWKGIPKFPLDSRRVIRFYLVCLGLGVISPIILPKLPAFISKLGDLIFSVNGSVATYALSISMFTNKMSRQQRKIFLAALVVFLMTSLSTGWLHLFVYPLLAFFLGEIQVKKKIPWNRVVLVGLAIIALQTAKSAFRDQYWGERSIGGRPPASIGESLSRASHWLEMASGNIHSLDEGVKETVVTRANHLSFFGNVVTKTPDSIPYLHGYSYRTVPAMFIPRALWPGKPSTVEVANLLAVKYDWLPSDLVGTVSVSPGLMDEAYMNYGYVGVIVGMLLLGSLIRWLTDNLGSGINGFGWQLVLVGFMCGGGFMITWTAQSYFGGFWQTVATICAIYWPFRLRRRARVSMGYGIPRTPKITSA